MYSRLLGGAAIALQVLASAARADPRAAAGSDALFAVAEGDLFAYLKEQQTLLVASDRGTAWEPLRAKNGDKLDVVLAAQAPDTENAVWAVARGELLRVVSQTDKKAVTLPAGFEAQNIRPHPVLPECALVNGVNSAVLGCLHWDGRAPVLRSTDDTAHCEFAGAHDATTLDHICAMSGKDAPLRLFPVNEASQVLRIGDRAITGVQQLVRTATHLFAVVRTGQRLELAVRPLSLSQWNWSVLEAVDPSSALEVVADSDAPLLITDSVSRGRELWTADSRGLKFTVQMKLAKGASVKRIGRALYTSDAGNNVAVSKDNGHSWDTRLAITPDVASVITSERLNVGYNAEHSMIALSYDGIAWKLDPLPFSSGDNHLLLFDHGSGVMVWSEGEDRVRYSLTGGQTWYVEPLASGFWDSRSRRGIAAFSRGPLALFIDKSDTGASGDLSSSTRTVDLTSAMGDRACALSDLELAKDSECIHGSRDARWVRKLSSGNCIMGPSRNFIDPAREACACSPEDFECDAEFVRLDDHQCAPGPELAAKLAKCVRGERQYISKGYKRISGNRCVGGDDLEGTTYYDCDAKEIMASAAGQTVSSTTQEFDGQLKDYLYLPKTKKSEADETVLAWTMSELFVSQDQGSTWSEVPIKNVLTVYKSETNANQIYVFSSDSVDKRRIWVSWTRGDSFEEVKLPVPPSAVFGIMPNVVTFHPKHPDWMLYTGMGECKTIFDCPGISFVSKDSGKQWTKVHDDVTTCSWVTELVNPTNEDLVYCFTQTKTTLETLDFGFIMSDDYFVKDNRTVPGLERVVGTVLDKPFVVTAREDPDSGEIQGFVSLNGKDFARQRFPPSTKFDRESGFTLMSTQTQSIMMFATANSRMAHEFGVLLKSNSNGTDFVETLENVNRAAGLFGGFVDFERVKSIEGVALANVVSNADDVVRKGDSKKLQTMITHSDGSLWAPLKAPDGMCNSMPNCNLHLHGYTERLDPRNSPSSPTAVGLIVARGNVGDSLGEMRSAQTFMSRDGGVTWIKVHDRPMYWEFGDSGSIVVLIDSQESTNKILYTLDEGDTWTEYEFSEVPMKVINLATIPSDSSRKFIVFGQPPVAYGDKTLAVQIDFSAVVSKRCDPSDFELWTPLHPQTNSPCLFGHEAKYRRKKRGQACYVGRSYSSDEDGRVAPSTPVETKTCKCQRSDYECDYNYKLNPKDGTCSLVPGLEPLSPEEQCENGAISWHKVTGYRKLPISTCEGGEMLSSNEESACPGMEDEFNRQRGGSGGHHNRPSGGRSFFGTLFLIIVVLAVIGIAVSGCVWAKSRGWAPDALPVHLPESFESGNMLNASASTSLDLLERASQQLSQLWAMVSVHIPFLGNQSPRDQMGFYSRMDDERYGMLDSDEFEDDESEEERATGAFSDTHSDANADNANANTSSATERSREASED